MFVVVSSCFLHSRIDVIEAITLSICSVCCLTHNFQNFDFQFIYQAIYGNHSRRLQERELFLLYRTIEIDRAC